jgi:hypothetical protein
MAHLSWAQNSADMYIDHLTIAVNDLAQAKKDFKALGFTIKPGRLHANSIENAHLKFQDGTSLELITASEPRDELAESYIEILADGDGPAYLCLGMDDPGQTEKLLFEFEPAVTNGSYYQWITFPKESVLSYLFFMKYANSPVDKKEHLQHQNGVIGIKAITLEKEEFSSELAMFQMLGSDISATKDNITMANQKLLFKSTKNQPDSASPVTTVTLLVNDIHETMEQLPKGIPFDISSANTITLPAEYCHGIQIVFEQVQ